MAEKRLDKNDGHHIIPPISLPLSSRQKDQGFTMVEVLISVVLTTVAFVGIFATYTTSLAVQKKVDERSQVLFLIQKTFEQVLAVDYTDLTVGTTIEIFEDELDGLLTITSKVETVVDSGMHALWTRFSDPTPTSHYKRVTITAEWAPEDTSNDKKEKMVLTTYRVEHENTVDFSERASSQLPWN